MDSSARASWRWPWIRQTPTTCKAGTFDGGVFESFDGGFTWEDSGLVNENSINALAFDPVDPSTLFAGTQGAGVLLSASSCK